MTLRRARLEDCEALAGIHAQSFPAPWTAADFAALLAQAGIAGWVAGAPPAGLLLARTAADEAEILTLAVAPAARRQGIAAALVAEVIRSLGGGPARRLFLEVAEDNGAARALYRSMGFEPRGMRAAYYARAGQAPADALVMALRLGGIGRAGAGLNGAES